MAGCTICTAPRQPLQTRESNTHNSRSARLSPSPSGCSLLKDSQLVAEGQDLSLEFNPRSEAGANGGKEGRNARAHIGTLSAETGKLNRLKKYRVSARDNNRIY